ESDKAMRFARTNIEDVNRTKALLSQVQGVKDFITPRRPCQEIRRFRSSSNLQNFLVVAFQGCGENAVLADRVVLANVCDVLPIRRECNAAVDVAHNRLRSAPQYRRPVKVVVVLDGVLGLAEIEVVSVRRKGETFIMRS